MIAFADALLRREGRLVAATRQLFARRLAEEADLDLRMTHLHRTSDIAETKGALAW